MLHTGIHPRPAHMLVRGRALGMGQTAARLAALLAERDVLGPGEGADLESRLALLDAGSKASSNARARPGALREARRLARRLADGVGDTATPDPGLLLALAFPDRIARRRSGATARYLLSNGRGAWLPEDDPLAAREWLVAAELDGKAREARIFQAVATDPAAIESALADRIEEIENADWDDDRGTVVVRRQRRLGALVLAEHEAGRPDPEQLRTGLLAAVRRRGLASLSWTEAAVQFCHRVEALRVLAPDRWPAFNPETLCDELEQWLAPFLAGMTHWRELAAMDLIPALAYRLGPERRRELDRLAPARIEVPTGQAVKLDYAAESGPVLAVKLQALFGWTESPRIADGRLPIVVHLLDPAGRPLAVTADLTSFWANAYPDVARQMRGRYPNHPWPDNPLSASPTMGTKRRGP